MKADSLKSGFVGVVVLAALLGTPAVIADEAQAYQFEWDWLPTSADAFLNGAVGDICNGSGYQLSEAELRKLFPLLQDGGEQSHQFRAAGGCKNVCACGACIAIDGRVVCAGCYACCPEGTTCKTRCEFNLIRQTLEAPCFCVSSSAQISGEPVPAVGLDIAGEHNPQNAGSNSEAV